MFLLCALLVGALAILPADGQDARWYQLSEQVVQLSGQGKYGEATPIAQQVVSIAISTYGANDVHVGLSLNRLGLLLVHQDKYADAETAYKRALSIMVAVHGENNSEVGTVLSNMGQMYRGAGRLADAEKYAQQALAIQEKVLAPDDVNLGVTITNLAVIYKDEGKNKDAEPLMRRALAIDEKAPANSGAELATDLNNLATVLSAQGKFSDAEKMYAQVLQLDEKSLGEAHPKIAEDLGNFAQVYVDEGKYSVAEGMLEHALNIEQQAAPVSGNMAWLMTGLGSLFEREGRYNDAAQLLTAALNIQAKVLGPDHPEIATTLDNLGNVYYKMGRDGDAENFYRTAINIREKKLGPMHPLLATSLINLGNIYNYDGRWGEAEALYRRAMDITVKAEGQESPQVAVILHQTANMLQAEGKLTDAERVLRGALAIDGKAYGLTSVEMARDLFILSNLLEDVGRNDQAKPLLQQCLTAEEKTLGPNHPDVAGTLVSLGTIDEREGKFGDAEQRFKRALTIDESVLGNGHPDTGGAEVNLATLYYGWDKPEQAEPYFDQRMANVLEQFRANAAYMSERQRLIFLATIPGTVPLYLSFALMYHERLPDLSGKAYDALLAEKGFIAQSAAALRAKILASGDKQTLAMLDKLTAEKTALAGLVESAGGDPADRRKQISQLTGEADQLEQQIVERSARLAESKTLASATWRDVQKALKPGEAAVEMARFQFHNGKSFTSTMYYIALVVTPESKSPEFVVLGEAQKLESAPMASFRSGVGATRGIEVETEPGQANASAAAGDTHAAYGAFWKPLEPALGAVKRVYLSPDGVLNQVPVGLLIDDAGKLVMEKCEVRVVNSTKDLLRPHSAAQARTALLVGNPKFDLSEVEERTALSQVGGGAQAQAVVQSPAGAGQRGGELAGNALPPLPGTEQEVNAVNALMKSAGWQPALYTGEQALKSVVEQTHGPRVVHVATHGFFLSDQELAKTANASGGKTPPVEDPMLRSGLFFAGADRVRAGAAQAGGADDGVLTAYEASELNLEGTELVVLSACETGLGQQSNGEGVFGLRRGLQEAGADAVMMSMWSVPDRETQELMRLFYKNWLGGMEKPEALRQAQLQERELVRKRYGKDLPFYWGAFVMVSR